MSAHDWTIDMELDAEAVDAATGATLDIKVSLKDLPALKLLVVELVSLHDDMRVGASPFADRLGAALHRFGLVAEDESDV